MYGGRPARSGTIPTKIPTQSLSVMRGFFVSMYGGRPARSGTIPTKIPAKSLSAMRDFFV